MRPARSTKGAALLLGAFLLPPQKPQTPRPSEVAENEAVRLLASGDAAGAEAKAREALAHSLRFTPEEEIEVRPDKGLLFDDMILAARKSYRERRARYFRTLGNALEAQKKWPASRKAYRRAMAIEPSSDLPLQMAAQEDLDLRSRLDLLFDAYLAPGADRASVESKLLATGAFRTRDALKASLDARRFPKLHGDFPEVELLPGVTPDFQATTDGGTINSSQLFRTGTTLVLYVPVDGCGRCSEELDGLTLPIIDLRKRQGTVDTFPLDVVAFVREVDLPGARRIVRLLGVPVGVGRKQGIPASFHFLADGELRFLARSGMTQIRLPTSGLSSTEIRRAVAAVLAFLTAAEMPKEDRPDEATKPLVTLKKGADDLGLVRDWTATIGKLEAGPAPLDDLYVELNRQVQRLAAAGGGRELGFGLLDAMSSLSGGNLAKARALGLVGDHLGEDLLSEAKRIDPAVRSTPQGESGALRVALTGADTKPRILYLQRSFDGDPVGEPRYVDFVLEDAGDGASVSVRWAGAEEREPMGIAPLERGAAFFRRCAAAGDERCRSARLVKLSGEWKVAFEGEPAVLRQGKLLEARNALVDPVDPPATGPRYYRDVASEGKGALERGLELFAASDFAGAASAFEAAEKEVDPIAPYDESDLVYDRARALEEQGKRREALMLFRSLGDVSYQALVDARAARIESGR